MKKTLTLFLALIMLLTLAACTNVKETETTTTAPQETTENNTAGTTSDKDKPEETTTSDAKQETTTKTPDVPVVPENNNKLIYEKVGSYVTVAYNKAYCEIEASYKKGVGSKENVTLTIKMNDGFYFEGWSEGNAIINKAASLRSEDSTYSFTASEDMTVYANYYVNLIYYPNGGEVLTGGESFTQSYSVVMYRCPNTLPEQGYFKREGYTLSEYNTKADGTGTAVSLGSRIAIDAQPDTKLYCVWEKQSAAGDFEFSESATGLTVVKYNGTDKTAVVPDYVDGKKVIAIGESAFFQLASLEKVIIPATVKTVSKYAIESCHAFSELVFFDSLMKIDEESIFDCPEFKHIRINAALDLYSNWMRQGFIKMDSLLAAGDAQKIVIYGGSGSLNGFDCTQMSEKLEGYEIINLGANANVTASLYFEFLNDVMNSGDIILWAPELGSYMFGSPTFSNRTWNFQAGHYDIFRYIDVSNYRNVFSQYTSFASDHMTHQDSTWAQFDIGTNQYGDNIAVRVHQDRTNNYSGSFRGSSDLEGITKYIRTFTKSLTEKGVRIYYTMAAMDKDGAGIDENIEDYILNFAKTFPEIDIISDYSTCLYDNSLFFDSEWHMINEGARLRTQNVIADILAQFEKEKAE